MLVNVDLAELRIVSLTHGLLSQVAYFKLRLMYVLAGLDRGFAANGNAAEEVETSVYSLTSASNPVVLSWASGGLGFRV